MGSDRTTSCLHVNAIGKDAGIRHCPGRQEPQTNHEGRQQLSAQLVELTLMVLAVANAGCDGANDADSKRAKTRPARSRGSRRGHDRSVWKEAAPGPTPRAANGYHRRAPR